MMAPMGLRGKLIFALCGVSLLAVLIAGFAYRLSSGPAFQQLIIDQGEEGFRGNVILYYRQSGTVRDITTWLRPRVFEPPANVPQSTGKPGDPRPGGLVRYGLADADGIMALQGGTDWKEGEKAPAQVLAQGSPIYVDGKLIGTILVPTKDPVPHTDAQTEYERRIDTALALAAALGLVVATLVSLILSRRIVGPLRRLTQAAREVAAGRVAQQIPYAGKDELGRLAEAFNTMSTDLARYENTRKQMAADVAHELRTPLTTIRGYVEAMRDGELPITPERLDSVFRQVDRLGNIVDDLRLLAMADVGALPLHLGRVALRELILQSVQAHAVGASQRGVTLRALVDGDGPQADVDPGRIQQVIEILLTNALRHTDTGQVVVSAAAEAGEAVLRVADTGSGIEPELLPRLFDRFLRGDGARSKDAQGSGLGLAIAKAIVDSHGGTIEVESTLGEGTVFTIRLPLAPTAGANAPLPQPELATAG